jgi:pyridoxal 5'-phosphate synthase pdxS subunit
MAKSRIGHFAEAQILESLGVDMIDESEGISNEHFTSPNKQEETILLINTSFPVIE